MATPLKTYALQKTLPRLPVPSLQASCALYLETLKPLVSEEALAKSQKLAADFLASPLSKSLQERLIDIERASPNNWLEDNFWLKLAYLEWREPLMVHSNWYILGKDDEHHPPELIAGDGRRPHGEFTYFQVRRAAHLIHRALDYKEIIDREELPVELVKGKEPRCMWQHSRIFGMTRIPLHNCDTLIQHGADQTHHIVVIVRDQLYKLPVYEQRGDTWVRLSVDDIERGLLAIVQHVLQLKDEQAPIPLLTSWDRDNWALARNHILALDPVNRETAHTVESSIFAVALDDYAHGNDTQLWSRTASCGHQARGNGRNRWYDKSFTVAVESSGKCIMLGEHSPADALIVSYVFDYMLEVPCPGPRNPAVIQVSPEHDVSGVQHLLWRTDDLVQTFVQEAQAAANATAGLSDTFILHFTEYGTNWVKKVGRVPPDAFYQMALQLAYYRLHGKVTATYETGSTRKFLRGRTETIRTCSVDSKKLVEGWWNPNLSSKEKYALLAKATSSHRKYTQLASEGKAFDRHLLVLRVLNANHQMRSPVTGKMEKVPVHPMFTDPSYTESQTWRLSTSGLQPGPKLMGTGFGAVVRDGYGINYMAAPELVKFGIECKHVPETATAEEFAKAVVEVMRDLRRVCEEVNGERQAKI